MNRKIAAASVAIALGLTATVGGGAYAHQQRVADEIASLVDQVAQAQQDERVAVDHLKDVIDRATDRLASDEGMVADPATMTTLAAVVKDAEAVEADADAAPQDATIETARSALSAALAEVDEAETARKNLSAALLAQMASNVRFRLDQDAAKMAEVKTALTDTLASGEATLADSEGKVSDNAVRQALRDALDVAAKVLDADVDVDSFWSLGQATTAYQAQTEAVQGATAAVTEAVAAKAEADRIAAEEAARKAAEEAAARKAATTKKSTTTRRQAPTTAAPTQSKQSIRQIVEAEAARFGMSVSWKSLGGDAGLYWSGSSTMEIDPNTASMDSAAHAKTVVRHEAAHHAIYLRCGTTSPSITNGRHENVTDAWADIYHGGISYHGYGYNAADAAAARSIHAGTCDSDAGAAEKQARAQRQANLKIGDRVVYLAKDVNVGEIRGVVHRISGDDLTVISDAGKAWTISRNMLDRE